MAENNPFAAFDSAPSAAAPAVDDDNPFRQFDSIEPPQPAAPANQPPASITPVQDMPGVSVIDDAEMRDFVDHFSAANQRAGTDKLNESRGRDFMDKLTNFLQYEAELVKGVPSGAVSGVGTGLHGAGAVKAGAESNIATFANQQIAVMDRIDAGDLEAASQLHPSIAGYGQMSVPQREMARDRLRRQFYGFTPTPVEQQGLYKAGSALKEHAKTILPAAPGYEEAWTRQVGEGLGSMAIGLPLALVGGGGTAGVLYGAMGAGEASERAIEYDRKEKAAGRPGLTQDDIIKSAIWGVAPGATDVLPVEILLGRLRVPPALAKLGAKTIGRIGGQAFLRMTQQAVVEGSQEGFQQLLQNLIESKYNPEQKLGEDILPNAAVGAGVGGVAQAGKEMAQLALRRFAGRRGSGSPAQPTGQPQAPGGAPQAAAPGAQAPSAGPEAASQAAKAPSSQPEAGIGQIQRDATPQTRMAVREQFNQYLALDEQLAAIPDDTDAPPELTNQAIDAEEAMVESFRATGLPGDNLARGTRQINSMDDVRRAFDEATPEEINEFWQGKAVGPAASGTVAGAGTIAASVTGGGGKAAPAAPLSQESLLRIAASDGAAGALGETFQEDIASTFRRLSGNSEATAALARMEESVGKFHEARKTGSPAMRAALAEALVASKQLDALAPAANLVTQYVRSAARQMSVTEADTTPRDLTTDFLRLIATPAPRDQWAKTLGVSEDELMPHVERAIASGLLRVDRNGVVRRNAAAVAEMEPEAEAEGQKIEAAIESGAGPMLAPGIIDGENVTLTPKAIDKIQELQAIAEEAVAKILPRDVRIEVVDNIAIDRLAHEDNLLALRSSKSAKVSEGTEGDSDELPGDGKGAGQAGDDASRSGDAGEVAAAVGGGGASGADAREGRILRQESATLRADGSIRTGRISTAARTAAPGGGDAETLQPVGASEFFETPGLHGVVTAMPVADHAGLAQRGAPASEYRLANLTYRLYAEGVPLTQAQLRNFQPNFRGNGDFHTPLIWARVSQHMDGTWEVSMVQRIAGAEAPKGMASKLYAAIEQDLGIRMSPSGILSKEGLKMWQKRSPESVKWHQWSKSEGYFISPRRIKDNLARIGMDLADSDPNKAEDHAIAMAERKELIKLWRQLPDDARGATPNTMFSLRTEPEAIEQVRRTTKIIGEDGQPLKLYHGTGQAFDEFDVGKSIEGAVFLASDPSIAKDYDYKGKSPRLIEAYVDIRNPKIIDAQGEEFADAMLGKAPEEGEDRFSISLPERNEKAKSFGDYQIGYSLEVSTPAGHKMEILLGVSEARDLTFRDVTRREVTFDILSEGGDLLRSGETATVFQDEVLEEVLRASASNTMQSPFQGKSLSRLFFKQIINEAKAQGYDGIWLRNGIDMGREPHDQIAAFDSSQVKIVHSAARGPDALATRIGDDGNVQALGQTNPDAKLISIGVRAVEAEARATGKTEKKVTVETARHEALEFFLAKGFIKPDEWATLADTARKENWVEAAGVRKPYTAQFGETMEAAQLEDLILKESIMVKYGEYEQGNYKPDKFTAKIFKRIKDFLDRLRNSLKSQGFQRWEDIFQKMDAGEMRQRYEARFGAPAAESKSRVTSKAVPAGDRIAAMAGNDFSMRATVEKELAEIFDAFNVKDVAELRQRAAELPADIKNLNRLSDEIDRLDLQDIDRHYGAGYEGNISGYPSSPESEAAQAAYSAILAKYRADDAEYITEFVKHEIKPKLKQAEKLAARLARTNPRIATMTLPGMAANAQLPLSPAPAGPTPGRAASAPGSLIDIQRNLRRKLGLTVTSGRLDPAAARAAGQAGGKLMGQFDRQTEVIRLRTLQDIDTEAHEVAHALENRYAGLAGLQQAHSAELDGVANLTGQTGLSEGFAEFFRLYLTNPPAADAHAPKFRAAFEDFLETEDAQTLQDIQEIQAQYQQWRDASSAGRITAAVKSGVPEGTWEKIRAEYDRGGLTRVGGMFWAYLEQVYKSRIDRTNPIRVLVERIARHAEASNQDIDLSTWRNPQMQARKISASDGIAYMDITRGVGWENAAGRGQVSLRDALSMAFGGTGYEHWTPQQRDDFGAYLIARRGRWLWQRYDMDPAQNRGRMASPPQAPQNGDWYFDTMARQRRVYLRGRWEGELTRAPDKHSRADHEQAVADLEAANPQFAVAAQMVYQFNRDLALKRHQAGLDSQEEFDYKNGTSDYVPWFRDMTDAIFAGTAASGRKVQGKFKLRGSYRDFINPVEGIIRQVYDTNREVAVNKPKRLLAELADQVKGAGRYAEIIPATRMAAQEVRVREALAQAAKQEGLPPEDAKDMISAVAAMIGDDAVATLFRSEQAGDGRDAILHYMDGGTLKMLQIHDDERGIARDVLGVFEMLRGTPAADSFYSMLTAAVRVPQKAITSSPGFLYRNIIRDTMQASALQVGYFPIVSNIRTVASNRARAQRGEEGWGELLARHGGIMGGIGRTDVRQIKQGRISELRSDTVTLRPWEKQFWKQTINPWHEDFWKWAEWSEANARQTLARISFDRAIADVRTRYPHMKPDQQVFVALESAVQRSRDYTDYARMGDAPSQVVANRLIMFLNPSLQGPDKIIRAALLAQTNEGRFAAVQAIRKKIAPLFSHEALLKDLRGQEKQFKDLTTSEVNGLKDALYVWVAISAIALTHLAIEVAFNDPEDLEDKSQLERATSVSFTINGVDYRIPRGFDIINVMSNAVKASYESWWREDPTAWARFRETLAVSLVPAHSSPILDLYTGWRLGKNNFFSSDIEPTYMKGRLPEDRYSAYTSNLSRRVAGTVNAVSPFEISPLMAEYTMTTIGADWARDILRAYDVLDPNKPALRWQEYPFLRAARGLRGTRGAGDFWDLMGQDGAFTRAGASYHEEAVKGKSWRRDDIRKFFEQRLKDEDAKAYSVMLGHYNAEQRRLHPMERAREFARGISGTMRDVASNRIDVPVTSKKEKRVEVSREVRAQALEVLGEIGRREYRNALIALKRPGYENREPQPVKPYLAELKTISPEIHKSLISRITNADGSARVYDYDKVRELWPETRKRLLATDKRERIIEAQGDVEFQDLIGKAQGARATGIR